MTAKTTRIEQLERQVAVLRDVVEEANGRLGSGCMALSAMADQALAEADRIAAEPVEATDAEVVQLWLSTNEPKFLILEDDGVMSPRTVSLGHAAAWVRAQGGDR